MFSVELCKELYLGEKTNIINKIVSFCLICIIILIPSTSMAKTLLICVGNSITQRGGNNGYVALIAKRLGPDYEVKNFGLSGRTMMKKGKPYWREKYFKDLFVLKPDIITLMLGTNDAKPGNWNRHGKDFEADASAMVDTLLSISSHPKLLLALPPRSFNKGYSNDAICNHQIPILRSIAEKAGVEVIDANTPMDSPRYFKDGCHPNTEGYKVLAEVFYQGITRSTKIVQQPYLSKSNLSFFQNTDIGVLKLSNQPCKRLIYTVNTSKQMKSGINIEKIFLLNGKLLSEFLLPQD